MEKEKQKIYTTVALVALLGLLFSCVAGALAGGTAGYLVGQRQARLAATRMLESGLGDLRLFPLERPMPWREEHPFLMPGPEEIEPPHEVLPPGMQGALIVDVVPGAPAGQAGLEAGDLIIAIDRTPINLRYPLPDVIDQYEPGDRVTIRFWRENEERSIRVKLTNHPDDAKRAYLGVFFEMMEGWD